jgi:sulfofructose kinase
LINSGPHIPTILCAGGAVQDIIMRVDKFPEPGSKVQASEFLITIGGQSGNAAVAIARLGAKVIYAGPLGDENDDIANRVVSSLTREGVDCSHALRVTDAISSVSTIMIDAAGEKMIATRRGRKLTGSVPTDPLQAVATANAVLLDNRYPDFVLPIAKAAQARDIPRVLDFDWGVPPDDPLLQACTHVIASSEALRVTTGIDNLPAALQKLRPHYKGFLAVTDGPEGIYWLDNSVVRHMKAFKVKVVDTLGAGDVFHGAFTLRLIETGNIVESMRFAGAAAAIKCTRFGGLMGAATREEVDGFLAQYPAE